MSEVAQDKLAKLEQIGSQGPSVEIGAMRLRLIKETMGAKVDQRADYAILAGCNAPFRFFHLKSFVDLLERLGVSYSFLSNEFCCGSSYLPKNDKSPELDALEPYACGYEGRNIAAAGALGAKAVVTFCPNCNARYRKHSPDSALLVLYWTDLVAPLMGGVQLEARVDFYEGCHRDQNVVLPNAIDPALSKRLMNGVKGLIYNEVNSDICCKQKPQDIFAAMETKTLVTP
ncbi:MAG: (Fe-S)-binding protein, partial [Dehalococcoidia bacterium]|nr:(Fe-S)-binding protein [Dehalococcoidia bacterium]